MNAMPEHAAPSNTQSSTSSNASVDDSDQQVAAGEHSGSFDLLRQRLNNQGKLISDKAALLNSARLEEFGRDEMSLLARTRARTENNCVSRDLVLVGDILVLGYNVFIGLRQETRVEDVFALYRLDSSSGQHELEPVKLEDTFLNDSRFLNEFRELYSYYKNAQLVQLRVHQGKLLAAFKIGERMSDIRVFRWQIKDDGTVSYIDNRGERDVALPPAHDFEWLSATREQHVIGKHSHVNILDALFVESIGGDLTVKIENNTDTGLGIYAEPVEDANQSLNDAEIAYAAVGELILLRVKPYRETQSRYLVYVRRTQQVLRVDAIGRSCVQLPEDHGIVFPGGYILQSGEHRLFSDLPTDLQFKRRVLSPNGEDVLYVFYGVELGIYVLLTYNLINKSLEQPLLAQGYARYGDGRMMLFTAESDEPTRNHAMQLWQTPFLSEDHAARQTPRQSFFGKIGNRELVRGLSELYSLAKSVREQDDSSNAKLPSRFVYEAIAKQARHLIDAYYWLSAEQAREIGKDVQSLIEVARATLDEFDKVAAIQSQARKTLQQTEFAQKQLLTETASRLWHVPGDFIAALEQIRLLRGQLTGLKEQRYMDVARLDVLDDELATEEKRVAERTVQFLSRDDAFVKIHEEVAKFSSQLGALQTTAELTPVYEALDKHAHNLDGLTELLGTLAVGDASLRTRILDTISSIYAELNKLRAEARLRRKQLSQGESAAEFAAQLKLFAQSVDSALEQAATPERCDELLTRLLAQLEELEGRFAEQDEYLTEIAHKRESVYETFEGKKQILNDARSRRAQAIMEAARRILTGIPKRLTQFQEQAQMEAYFASDSLLNKLRASIEELRKLGNQVAADDLAGQLKSIREQAQRSLRDRSELVTGNTIRLGRHAFTVNQQLLDLTIIARQDKLSYHISGTDYFCTVEDARLEALRPYWGLEILSESPQVYRAEYLAYQIMESSRAEAGNGKWQELLEAAVQTDTATLETLVRRFAAARFQEGYQKGVHDHDASAILRNLVPMVENAGLLRYKPLARAVAVLYWQHLSNTPSLQVAAQTLQHQAEQAELMSKQFGNGRLLRQLAVEQQQALQKYVQQQHLDFSHYMEADTESMSMLMEEAASYLLDELGQDAGGVKRATAHEWICSRAANDIMQGILQHLTRNAIPLPWQEQTLALHARWQLASEWVHGYITHQQLDQNLLPEVSAALLCNLPRRIHSADLQAQVSGMLGEHVLVTTPADAQDKSPVLNLQLNDFMRRLSHHVKLIVPAYQELQTLRLQLVQEEKARLHLEQFQAKPLSSFVRNRLIDEVYLPMVGDNLAKQIGAAGAQRRTDSMGMLLLISPPGYGKTTLMEYLGDRLGMIFVRINCPVLGHNVTSLDPAQASSSAARMELEKLNLGLAMGNNVMLYLDDIQHTHPEFLQKFIALADGTRRIEGVWRGASQSYDLRGKRFAIVMAGNPYTESGEMFKIPDMLANRADIYNLGDVLSGKEDAFALSYIENALVSHPALHLLSTRDPQDTYQLIRMAQGEPIPASDLKHVYSQQEITEICALLQRLFKVRDALLKVNQAYIASASQDDHFRTEPAFKLQGSYRNMSKLTPKISALMHDDELDLLLRDHYRGEAQTLTVGAEENLLKLAHLLGQPQPEEQARWQDLLHEFGRLRKQGGADADGATKVANLLADISQQIAALGQKARSDVHINMPDQEVLQTTLKRLAESYEQTLLPIISAMNHKMRLDHSIWDNVREMSTSLHDLEKHLIPVRYAEKKKKEKDAKPAEDKS